MKWILHPPALGDSLHSSRVDVFMFGDNQSESDHMANRYKAKQTAARYLISERAAILVDCPRWRVLSYQFFRRHNEDPDALSKFDDERFRSALRARFAASGMEPTIIDLGPVPSAIRDTRGLLEAVHAYNRGQVLDAVSLPQVTGGHLPEAAALILGVPASQAQPSRFLAEPPAAWTSRMREQSQGISSSHNHVPASTVAVCLDSCLPLGHVFTALVTSAYWAKRFPSRIV